MNNVPMRFKIFEFSVNPQKIEIKAATNLKQLAVPFDAFELQEFGIKPLIISGEGKFVGENAQLSFDSIFALFLQGGAGELFLSGAQPMQAIMTKLVKGLEPIEKTISYSFEFVEVPQKQSVQLCLEIYHTIKQGESLWHIARDYDVSIESLLKLNQSIQSPWNVETGDKVRVR
ncbi:MAG: LysM domain-containing protein [Oscillospiraceae bacterium]